MTAFSAPTGANTTRSCGFRSSVGAVDNRSEIRQFLAGRRAKVTPGQVGLPTGGGRRRVPGLRREEVAMLAGVSTDWYIRLEKGHITGVSAEVLDAVARALQLDEADRNYLFNLVILIVLNQVHHNPPHQTSLIHQYSSNPYTITCQ